MVVVERIVVDEIDVREGGGGHDGGEGVHAFGVDVEPLAEEVADGGCGSLRGFVVVGGFGLAGRRRGGKEEGRDAEEGDGEDAAFSFFK